MSPCNWRYVCGLLQDVRTKTHSRSVDRYRSMWSLPDIHLKSIARSSSDPFNLSHCCSCLITVKCCYLFFSILMVPFTNTDEHIEAEDKMAAVFICLLFNQYILISINISLEFVQIMAWRRPNDKPLSLPMMFTLLAYMCIIRPQWVNVKGGLAAKIRKMTHNYTPLFTWM